MRNSDFCCNDLGVSWSAKFARSPGVCGSHCTARVVCNRCACPARQSPCMHCCSHSSRLAMPGRAMPSDALPNAFGCAWVPRTRGRNENKPPRPKEAPLPFPVLPKPHVPGCVKSARGAPLSGPALGGGGVCSGPVCWVVYV